MTALRTNLLNYSFPRRYRWGGNEISLAFGIYKVEKKTPGSRLSLSLKSEAILNIKCPPQTSFVKLTCLLKFLSTFSSPGPPPSKQVIYLWIFACACGPYHSSYSGEPMIRWSDSVDGDLYLLNESELKRPYERSRSTKKCAKQLMALRLACKDQRK